jgi:V8-like Glu-specific endopeptidase
MMCLLGCAPDATADEIQRALANEPTSPAPAAAPTAARYDNETPESVRNLPPAATASLQAAPLSGSDFLSKFFGSVFGNGVNGSAEAVCFGSKIRDIEEFKGTPSFPRLEIASLQRATVRIAFQTTESIAATAESAFKRRRYNLGDVPYNAETAFCTGTMIDRNLVLTAGHCVNSDYFETEAKGLPRMPRVFGRREPKLSDTELGKFMMVQFNEQAPYAIADADEASVAGPMEKFQAKVIEVVSSEYSPPRRDFAILKLDPADLPEHVYSIGWSKMLVDDVPEKNTALAVIQHPNGGKKRIATGTVLATKDTRIFYANLSTDPGSSGAGILSGGKLVGIHTRGYCSDSASAPKDIANSNQGVRLTSIAPILKSLLKPSK